MKQLLQCLLLLFLLTGAAQETALQHSTILEKASLESVGMSVERVNRIDAMLRQAVEAGEIPGAVALIARNGKIVFHKAYGMSDLQNKKPFEKDAIFRIASQTKAITATAVMQLWEEGKFGLDDPISKYIPEFTDTGVIDTFNEADSTFTTKPLKQPITIRHLITHTSGIGYGMIDGDDRFRKIYQKAGIIDAFTIENKTIGANIKKLARLPLHHEPGAQWTYSEGLDVLGYLVELISGMPLDQYFRTRILDPLGMNDTWFYLPEEKAARLVPVQHKEDGKWEVFTSAQFEPDYPIKGAKTFFAGGAGLSSTAGDYSKFLQMYLNHGMYNGDRLLSRTTIRSIMGNQIGGLWAGGPKDYGLAFALVNDHGEDMGGIGSEGTFDWGGYFNTQYFADPETGIIGILMKQTQGDTNDQTGWKFRQMVFAAVND
jgi:CubicO group peptidase (beta-lactamase class C family)